MLTSKTNNEKKYFGINISTEVYESTGSIIDEYILKTRRKESTRKRQGKQQNKYLEHRQQQQQQQQQKREQKKGQESTKESTHAIATHAIAIVCDLTIRAVFNDKHKAKKNIKSKAF